MAEKVITAYDARCEEIKTVRVVIDPTEEPRVTRDAGENDETGTEGMKAWDRTLTELMRTDLFLYPMFDGERISASRANFTISLSAREAPRLPAG